MLESDLSDVYRLDGTLVRKMQIDIAARNTPLDAVGGMGGGDVTVVLGSGGEEFGGRIQDLTEEEWKQLRGTPLMVRLRDRRLLRFIVEDTSGEMTRCRIIEP
jgi:hypothetical protein